VVGGIVGGMLGSKMGKGKGRDAAIIGSTLVGSLIGKTIGSYMDRMDRMDKAQIVNAIAVVPTGQSHSWQNPNTHFVSDVRPVSNFYPVNNGGYCRNFQTKVIIDGRPETLTGTACQQSSGMWRIE